MNVRAIIVDDEQLARRAIRRCLARHPDVEIVAECLDGASAVRVLLAEQPDLVFLDVQIPEMDGFDVVRSVGIDRMPATIFVTAYDRYALRAFDANALDYLLKPFSQERFDRALARARERMLRSISAHEVRRIRAALDQIGHKETVVERLPVNDRGRIVFVNASDVEWIEASGNYARLHLRDRTYEIRETLTRLEQILDSHFARIHRSTIVNVRRIKEIQPWFRGYHVIVLESGQKLRMSRYQRDLARRLGVSGGER